MPCACPASALLDGKPSKTRGCFRYPARDFVHLQYLGAAAVRALMTVIAKRGIQARGPVNLLRTILVAAVETGALEEMPDSDVHRTVARRARRRAAALATGTAITSSAAGAAAATATHAHTASHRHAAASDRAASVRQRSRRQCFRQRHFRGFRVG